MDEIETLKAFSDLDEALRLIEIGTAAARAELKEARTGWIDRKPIAPHAEKVHEIVWKVRNEAIFLPRAADRVRSVARACDVLSKNGER